MIQRAALVAVALLVACGGASAQATWSQEQADAILVLRDVAIYFSLFLVFVLGYRQGRSGI